MRSVDLSFLGKISDDDQVMLNRLLDWTDAVTEKYIDKFSFFLDERQKSLCEKVLRSAGFENYRFFGGYNGAQRTVLGLFAPYSEPADDEFPIIPLTFSYRQADKLSHRDFLGCIMAQRVSRESVGDIIVSDGRAAVFLYKTVVNEISFLDKIGRVGVKVSQGFDEGIIPVQKFQQIDSTVASLRLDCVLSAAIKVSREKASALIKSKGAEVNHTSVYAPDLQLAEGSVFSVKGFGKFILEHVGGFSKKERIHITLQKYV